VNDSGRIDPASGDVMRVVTTLGQDLRVAIRTGTGDAPPLLLCCGIGAGFEALQPFVDALDPAIEVIRFDVPGVGGSPTGPVPYGFPGTAYLAARMVRQLGYPQVDVLGLSWGGALAQQLALQHRHLVRTLVLVSTSTGSLMIPGHPRVLIRMFTPRRFRDPDYAASIASILYGGSAREYPDQVRQILGDSMRIGSKTGYLHQLLAGLGWTSLPWLPFVRQPTLILAGNDDPIVPVVNARILRCLLPNAKLHVYDGGHVALVTEADVLAPVVAHFLNDHPHGPETPTTRRRRR
jgi:poly(3-hydroxyalkanoate) depolymerase